MVVEIELKGQLYINVYFENQFMKIDGKQIEFDAFSDMIIKGVRKANYKLVIVAAANNESLVTGDDQGNSKLIPAKEILEKFIAENSEEFRSVFEEVSGSMKFCVGNKRF